MLHIPKRLAQLSHLVVLLERGQWCGEVALCHLLSRLGQESQRLGGSANASPCKEENDKATDTHAEKDNRSKHDAPSKHKVAVLNDSHSQVCKGYRFEIDIIRRTLQVFHPKVARDFFLLCFEDIDVEGIGTQNPVVLVVDNLDGEIYGAVVVLYAFLAVEEFPLHYILHFANDLVEPQIIQVNAIHANLVALAVNDGQHIATVH